MLKPRYYRFVFQYLSLLAFKKKTIGGTVERMAARQPEALACAFENDRVSYAELNARSNRRAHVFRELGIGKGDVVCLMMENRPEFIETVVGLAKLGAVAALINHQLKGASLAHCINVSGAKQIVVGLECLEPLQAVMPELQQIGAGAVYVDTRWTDYQPPSPGMHDLNTLVDRADTANPPAAGLNSLDTVLYIYTSGTTGLPKAARINHYRWYAAGLVMGYYALSVERKDVIYCPLPLFHSNGILIAFGSAMIGGAGLGLTRRFSASQFWQEARRYGATAFIYIGEVLRYLVNQEPHADEQAHTVERILGNGLRPDIWPEVQERFKIPVIREFYASTEGNIALVNVDNTAGSIGSCVLKFSDNARVVKYDVATDSYIRDDKGFCVLAAEGETGELLAQIKAAQPFHGYSNAKDTERKIMRDVLKKGDAYFRTGDLVTKDGEGHYFFVDRIGDTYRWKGENVSTQEVQGILSGFEGVHLASVYGVAVPGSEGRVGMAAMQMEANRPFDPAAFYRFAAERLASYSVPAFVRLVGEMDVTGTFKLRKTDLQEQGFDPAKVDGALYYLDRNAGSYAKLDADAHRRIVEGQIPF